MNQLICKICKLPMVQRLNKKTNKKFWGCQQFPKCRDKKRNEIKEYNDRQRRLFNRLYPNLDYDNLPVNDISHVGSNYDMPDMY